MHVKATRSLKKKTLGGAHDKHIGTFLQLQANSIAKVGSDDAHCICDCVALVVELVKYSSEFYTRVDLTECSGFMLVSGFREGPAKSNTHWRF